MGYFFNAIHLLRLASELKLLLDFCFSLQIKSAFFCVFKIIRDEKANTQEEDSFVGYFLQ